MEENHQENPVNKDATIAKRFILFLKDDSERSKKSLKPILRSTKAYPPNEHTNKFINGRIVEKTINDCMKENGIDCKNEGAYKISTDLSVKENILGEEYNMELSIKSSSSKSNITIKNYHGKKQYVIGIPPTLLVLIGKDKEKTIDIVYIDDEVIKKYSNGLTNDQLFSNKDSRLEMKRGGLNKLIKLLPEEYIFGIKYEVDCLDEQDKIDIIELAYEAMTKK